MSEPTYTTMIYKEYPVTLTISCGIGSDSDSASTVLAAIAKKIYGTTTVSDVAGGICEFTVDSITTVGGFIMKFTTNGNTETYSNGYLFIIAQKQSGEGDSAEVTTDLKAWKYLENSIDGAAYIWDNGNRVGVTTHGQMSLGVAFDQGSDGHFYVPRKSFMLEGRHEDIIKGQNATSYPASKITTHRGLL